MSPVARRSATPPPAPPQPAADLVNFGALDFYAEGGNQFGIPEGYYSLYFDVMMHQFTKKDGTPGRGAPSLKVRVTAYNLQDPKAEPIEAYYSMGSKTHLSFQPDPATGKGLVAVPGGPAATANDKTNWAILLRSLYDCGLPQGVFTNNMETIDGVWVHMTHIPEPEERKSFDKGPKTGEQQAQTEEKRAGTIAIVSEILDEGKPWEGTGGVPEEPVEFTADAPAAAPAKVTPMRAPAAKPVAVAPKAPGRPAPPAAAAPAADANEDVLATAEATVSSLLKEGMPKVKLRTDTFKALKADPAMQQAVMNAFFDGGDEAIDGLINPLGFKISGASIVRA